MNAPLPPRVGFLSVLNDEELSALMSCADRIAVKRDAVVLRQDQHNASLFIVERGLLHATRRAHGRDVLLGRLEPGSVFGEISLFDPGPVSATVHALAESQLIQLHRAQLDAYIAQRPDAAVRIVSGLLAEMAKRLRQTDERFVDSVVWGGLLK